MPTNQARDPLATTAGKDAIQYNLLVLRATKTYERLCGLHLLNLQTFLWSNTGGGGGKVGKASCCLVKYNGMGGKS